MPGLSPTQKKEDYEVALIRGNFLVNCQDCDKQATYRIKLGNFERSFCRKHVVVRLLDAAA